MLQKPHRSCSIPILHSGTSHFRHGVLQLMIHTIDPIAEGMCKFVHNFVHFVNPLTLTLLNKLSSA